MSQPGAKFWGVVPAAGSGSRMGAEIPKQYLQLGDATVIEHTLSALLDCGFIEAVAVALDPADTHFNALALAAEPRLIRAAGGAERSDSVLAALRVLAQFAAEDDWVLVHDAARPCLELTELEQLRDELQDDPVGGLLALPVTDTVKRVDEQGRVQQTLDRDRVWLAQTPQMFRYGLLLDALQQAHAASVKVTDEAAAVERLGLHPRVVAGSSGNRKLTRPEDLEAAEAWLAAKGE